MYYALHITVHVLGEHAPHTYCVAKGGVAVWGVPSSPPCQVANHAGGGMVNAP